MVLLKVVQEKLLSSDQSPVSPINVLGYVGNCRSCIHTVCLLAKSFRVPGRFAHQEVLKTRLHFWAMDQHNEFELMDSG